MSSSREYGIALGSPWRRSRRSGARSIRSPGWKGRAAPLYWPPVDAATSATLIGGAAALGISLAPGDVARFDQYLALLTRWNPRITLTRVTDPAQRIAMHFPA